MRGTLTSRRRKAALVGRAHHCLDGAAELGLVRVLFLLLTVITPAAIFTPSVIVRARLGLGRVPQRQQLFDTAQLFEVRVGVEQHGRLADAQLAFGAQRVLGAAAAGATHSAHRRFERKKEANIYEISVTGFVKKDSDWLK